MNNLILIAEDEQQIADVLDAYLTREGFRTVRAGDGHVAVELQVTLKPDLMLLDIAMPRRDGWEVLAEVRRKTETPIIVITALDKDIDRLQALRIGADDYIVKPFNPVEVVARVKAVLRRAGLTSSSGILRYGDIAVDLDSYLVKVEKNGQSRYLKLTLTEFRILAHLAHQPMRVYSRSDIVDACLLGGDALDRTVDSHISNLRKKFEQLDLYGLLSSVRGVGYRLGGTD
ncbi:response regulator [Hoeflea sp. WL0058]|uniref:Response regulator n=1 Tax=Flavimaribacter sediminis TaxID=2865987 RepID=A0AAE2ZQB9_9HYPH|nr:response regulator [Flavimaribacter sediminis]MBW8638941.1 response regulator [Flavimaribacter sediminis]